MAEHGTKFLQEMGHRIAELCKAQGLTQGHLAELLGISQQLVTFYEKGHRRVPVDLLPDATRLLGVSVEELLGLSNGTSKRGPTPKLQQQLERLSRLPCTKQRVVSEMLEMVLQRASH